MLVVYRRLLVLYPKPFRARFGEEMLQVIRSQGGRVSWPRMLRDLVGSVLVQRWEMRKMKKNWWLVPLGIAIALGGTVTVVGTAFSVATLLVLLAEAAVAGLLIGAVLVIGGRARGAEFDYSKRLFRWWWILAGLIGATELIMITAQLIREPKATNLFAFGLTGSFAFLVFTGLGLKNRRTGNILVAIGVFPLMNLFWSIIPPIAVLVVIIMALSDNVRMSRQPQMAG